MSYKIIIDRSACSGFGTCIESAQAVRDGRRRCCHGGRGDRRPRRGARGRPGLSDGSDHGDRRDGNVLR